MWTLLADNTMARISMLMLLFIAVTVLSFAGVNMAAARARVRARLGREASASDATINLGSLRASVSDGAWVNLINRIEKSGLSLTDTKDDALRHRLIAAGFTAPHAPRAYTLVRLLMTVGLPIVVLTMRWLGGSGTGLVGLYVQGMIAALVGLYLPPLFVRAKADRRRTELTNGFPDALDLMLVCVEAGQGIEAAFNRVGQEMMQSHPLIAEQLSTLVLELRAGRSREDALRRLAERAGVDEIRAFSTLLIQSGKLGSSISQTLRIYAAEMREKRRMRAEEKAHRLPVLLSIPLVACMLPVMIGVLMLPAVIRVLRVLLPAMAGDMH